MKIFQTLQDLAACVGKEVAVSDWFLITQDRIDLFAKATGDHQWIHVDPEKSKYGPFGVTIAHGFLTLSLLPQFFESWHSPNLVDKYYCQNLNGRNANAKSQIHS